MGAQEKAQTEARAILRIDEKWSVEYHPASNDAPGRVLRYGEPTFGGSSDWKNDTRAMFYALLERDTALEAQAAELAAVHQRYVDANETRIDAEASLAEARKVEAALERDLMDARARYMGAEGLLDLALNTLDTYADPAGYTDNLGEPYSSEDQHHPGTAAREVAANIRAARRALTGGKDG